MADDHEVAARRSEQNTAGAGSWRRSAVVQAAVLLCFSLVWAVMARDGCVDPGPPVDRPEAGTARAGYCSAINGDAPWLVLVAVPLALLCVAVALPVYRRRPALGAYVVALMVLALFANAMVARLLAFSYTI